MDEMWWSPETVGWFSILAVVLLVVYYLFLGRALLQMLREQGSPVLLAFACLALIPAPPLVLMGIVLMIVWGVHRGGTVPAPAPAPAQAARPAAPRSASRPARPATRRRR